MKQFFKFMTVTLLTCLLFGSCAAQKDQSAQKVSQATKVTEALDARDFTISIDRMIPSFPVCLMLAVPITFLTVVPMVCLSLLPLIATKRILRRMDNATLILS